MKIVLADNTEITVASLHRNYRPNDTNSDSTTLDIQLLDGVSIEDAADKLTVESCKTITVKRDGFEDIVYEGYELIGITENVSASGTSINVNLIKENN